MRQRFILILLLCLLSVNHPVLGMPYTAGKYTVDVVVRNTTMALIPDAKVSVWLDGQTIYLKAKAAGYESRKATINVGSSTFYKYDFTLPDMPKKLYAIDMDGNLIKSAYFEMGQYGFAGNVYGITVYIPKNAWPRPALKRVDIFDQMWGGPWKLDTKMTEMDEFIQIKMTMSRKALDWTSLELLVVFDTSKRPSHKSVSHWFDLLTRMERNPKAPIGMAAGLGEFLSNAIPAADVQEGAAVPETLRAYYSRASRFATLHRDAPEN